MRAAASAAMDTQCRIAPLSISALRIDGDIALT
jgi:hypothetical protein